MYGERQRLRKQKNSQSFMAREKEQEYGLWEYNFLNQERIIYNY